MLEDSLSVAVTSAASVDELWAALTTERSTWWPELTLTPAVGAPVHETWEEDGQERSADGHVTGVAAPHLLVFEWRQPAWPSSLEVRFAFERVGGHSVVTLTERGFALLPDAVDLRAAHEDGWSYHLTNLLTAASR